LVLAVDECDQVTLASEAAHPRRSGRPLDAAPQGRGTLRFQEAADAAFDEPDRFEHAGSRSRRAS
jgi:hypothetical protein